MASNDNEIAIFNRQLAEEKQSQPIGSKTVEWTGKALGTLASIPPLSALGPVAKGFDFVSKMLSLGVPTIEENLKLLGELTEIATMRIEEKTEDLREKIESPEFIQCMASAVLQTQRTAQKERIKRMASILSNTLSNESIDPEETDDMLRAAAELTSWDILVLQKMYDSQKGTLSSSRATSFEWSQQVGSLWINWSRIFEIPESDHLKLRASLSRLQSVGFVAEAQTNFVKDGSLARQAFGLLPTGANFLNYLRETVRVTQI